MVQIANTAEGFRENVRLCSLLCCQLEGEVCYGDCEFAFCFLFCGALRVAESGEEKCWEVRQREEVGPAKRQGGGGAEDMLRCH